MPAGLVVSSSLFPLGLGKKPLRGTPTQPSRNTVSLMAVQYQSHATPIPDRNMFHPIHTLKLTHYTGPPASHATDSELCTNSFFVSFPKASAPKPTSLAALPKRDIFTKTVRDPERAWNYYNITEFYSPFKTINQDAIAALLRPAEATPNSPNPPAALPPCCSARASCPSSPSRPLAPLPTTSELSSSARSPLSGSSNTGPPRSQSYSG